jgi:hypothetical protein
LKGLNDATTDRAQIEAWWSKWPDANIGIATGHGLTVMDIDGERGREELIALVARHLGDFPSTLGVRTGNGGHLYFACEGPRSHAKGSLHIRGDGGYVIAPPSIHRSGRHYEWANALEIAVSPEWLREWFLAGGEGTKPSQQRPTNGLAVAQQLPTLDAPPAWVLAKQSASRLLDSATIKTPWTLHEQARVRSALKTIPPDDYDDWLYTGMALHDLRWKINEIDIGFNEWDIWSQRLPEKYTREALIAKWQSFERSTYRGKKRTIGSIYDLAVECGWDGTVTPIETNEHKINGANGHSFHFDTTTAAGGPIFVDFTEKGKIRGTCVNSKIALRALGVTCQHDRFHDKLEVGGQIMGEWAGELIDNTVHMLRTMIHETYRFDPGTVPTHDAAVQECLAHAYDPVADYLDGLTWDKKPRLENWMTTYLGAEPSRLNSMIGMLGLIAACRRVRAPGAKFDAITVLISNEGHGKSSAIEVLAGESNFSDAPILNIEERAQQEAMQGVWLYEIADLAGMSKADTDKVKAFASRRIDRARPAYARSRIDRPRRCIFFATTNLQHFLKSQTGNRRFWPVQVGRIRLDELARDRDQLWAEANAIEQIGVPLGLPEALWGEAAAIQIERMELDPWDDVLGHLKLNETFDTVDGREWRIGTRDLLSGHLAIAPDRQTDGIMKRLSYIMRRLGWDGPKKMRVGAFTVRGFSKRCTT